MNVLAFNFCWIPLHVETLRLHLCVGASVHVYTVFCFDTPYTAHILVLTSNISFVQLSSLLSGYPASS